jgi:hypothetical protein
MRIIFQVQGALLTNIWLLELNHNNFMVLNGCYIPVALELQFPTFTPYLSDFQRVIQTEPNLSTNISALEIKYEYPTIRIYIFKREYYY